MLLVQPSDDTQHPSAVVPVYSGVMCLPNEREYTVTCRPGRPPRHPLSTGGNTVAVAATRRVFSSKRAERVAAEAEVIANAWLTVDRP